jgi:hypothetical protein
MAVIVPTELTGVGPRLVTVTTLEGTDDTLVYNYGKNQVLFLKNPTVSPVTPTIVGSEASDSYPVEGVGTIDLSNGLSLGAIAAGATKAIPLNSIKKYLAGGVSITGGLDLEATLVGY